MTRSVGCFYNSIDGVQGLKDSELVSLFVFYLTVECGCEAASVTLVGDCFKECDLSPPSRIAPYLSEGLSSEPQKFIKVHGGYKLQRHYREVLLSRFALDEELIEEVSYGKNTSFTPDEQTLIDLIGNVVPSAEISYRQALADLNDDSRVSFRGPALELREVLREVLDHYAPDKEVIAGPGFHLDPGRAVPTMKQKVRHILRSRKIGKTKIATPEDSVSAVDAIVSDLTRSAYDLGSLATHVSLERKQVIQLKRYIDAVLHDILDSCIEQRCAS